MPSHLGVQGNTSAKWQAELEWESHGEECSLPKRLFTRREWAELGLEEVHGQ